MQKKYVIVLFSFFLIGNAGAQLPNDLAYFTQTLKNIVLMLTHAVPPPPPPPGTSKIVTIPAIGKVTLPNGKEVKGPSGTKITISDEQVTLEVPPAGGNLLIPDMGVRTDIKVSSNSKVVAGTISRDLLAGESISVSAGPATVTPTVVPPPTKPSTGTGTGTGTGTVVTPPASIPFVNLPQTGITRIIVPPGGGEVKLPMGDSVIVSSGSEVSVEADGRPVVKVVKVPTSEENIILPPFGGVVGSAFASKITLPNKTVVALPANKYINIEDEGVVIVQPEGAVPPPLIPPSGTGGGVQPPPLTPPGKPPVVVSHTPVSPGGVVATSIGNINLPKGSKVKQLPEEVDIELTTAGSIQLPNKERLTAPVGSKIIVTKTENIVTIPVITKQEKVIVPAGTGIVASSPVTVQLPDNTKEDLAIGAKKVIPVGGTVIVTPFIPGKPPVVPPPLVPPLAPTDRKKDKFKTVGNVIQLEAPASASKNAQAISGYVAVYYAFNELSRFINKKDIILTFDEFLAIAVRSIKKRRIQIAFKDYLANLLKNPPYLVKEENVPKKVLLKLEPKTIRNIYYALLNDLASFEAEKYITTKYKEDKSGNDRLDPLYTLDYKTIINDLTDKKSNIVDKKRDHYIKEIEKEGVTAGAAAATLNALINEKDYLKMFANIDETMDTKDKDINKDRKIQITGEQVLNQLHQPNEFGREEGTADTKAMPTGLWLKSSDIKYLFSDPTILKAVGLADVSDMVTTFDDLNLLKSVEYFADLGPTRAQELVQKEQFIKQDLEKIATKTKDTLHIFIVNIGYSIVSLNRSSDFRWLVIVRYPNNEYVVADPLNTDRTKDNVDLNIIKESFAKT